MKPTLFQIILLLLLSFIVANCDRPECTNSNPFFEKYAPDTEPYKDELVNQLNLVDTSKLSYWLEKYEEKNGQEYLYFIVQGDGLCAKIVLTVKQWNMPEELKARKVESYQGAEFEDLKFDIQQDSLRTEFIFKSYATILD